MQSIKDLCNYRVVGEDGQIGSLAEFYFEDLNWTIRYLVVNTGHWYSGKQVLVCPASVGPPDREERRIPVFLIRQQIENWPEAEAVKPVWRQMETELSRRFGPSYWGAAGYLIGGAMVPPPPRVLFESSRVQMEGPGANLRSSNEVIGYHIEARNGEIGHIEDFLFDHTAWTIQFIVADTRNWLPGKKVVIMPQSVEEITWAERRATVDLLRETFRDSPEFNWRLPISESYKQVVHDYYDRHRLLAPILSKVHY